VEFGRLGHPLVDPGLVVDTLALARRKHPMGPNSLDALCRRYGIDNARRTKHGALLDSELLAEVYIELIGGKQAALILDSATAPAGGRRNVDDIDISIGARPIALPSRLTAAERSAHASMVGTLGENALWLRVAAEASSAA
ncbi:MAG: DNA polymerase III subunit epsilon, partial [Mesorhizobium sp.]